MVLWNSLRFCALHPNPAKTRSTSDYSQERKKTPPFVFRLKTHFQHTGQQRSPHFDGNIFDSTFMRLKTCAKLMHCALFMSLLYLSIYCEFIFIFQHDFAHPCKPLKLVTKYALRRLTCDLCEAAPQTGQTGTVGCGLGLFLVRSTQCKRSRTKKCK